MYAEFSYDVVPGSHSNQELLQRIVAEFATKPDGVARLICDLLSDTFICEIQHTQDYESTHRRLVKLRTEPSDQFNYSFSLRRKGAPM
jgi:hypothetical protein